MNKQRLLAGTLAFTIVVGSTAASGVNAYAATQGNGKEEVVYIMTDANGSTENVNVVNIFGKGNITDYGSYSSVKMLNTNDSINKNGDVITFSTDKDKVYYQGTMENVQIPWNITFTYTLDGKTIKPEELAGKSGALKINIKIEKNDSCTTDFYDSYALQAALTLDTDKCKNIQADGATLANVGSDKQISYTVLPGKGLDAQISADVTDFEMDAVSINGVKLDLNVDIDDEELMDKVREITDAAKSINDGATAVSEGSSALKEAGGSLADGSKTLDSGVADLDNGINSLNTGVLAMQEGLNTLNSRSGDLTGGSAQMYNALKTLQSELANVSMSTEQLSQLTKSSAAIKSGIADIYSGAEALKQSIAYDSYKAAMKSNGLDIDQLSAGNTQAINTLGTQLQSLNAALAQIKQIPGYETNEALVKQAAELEAQIDSLSTIVTLLSGNNAAIMGTEQYYNAVYAGADELVNGIAKLQENYENFDKAIVNLADSLINLSVNVSKLGAAVTQLTESYGQLDSGINEYTDGVAEIVAAYSQIADGTGSLVTGSKALAAGSDTLKQGTVDMYSGITSLDDGAKQLNDGTKEFYEQTDGMDTKIEDTVNEMLDSISGGDSEIVSFVSDKNTDVKAVQFVIKTAAIQKQEVTTDTADTAKKLNFWQKLLKLFGLYKE